MIFKKTTPIFLIIICLGFSCNNVNNTVDYEKEKQAIIDVIKKETRSYYEKDLETWMSTYVQEPYQQRIGYWEGYKDKLQYLKGWNELYDHKTKKRFERKTDSRWDESTFEMKNINLRIYQDAAWITFEQTDWEAGSKKLIGNALGTRVLEKIDGQWKIVFNGYWYYPNKEEAE